MPRRPISVTVIACLYILVGAAGFVIHLTEFRTFQYDTLWVELVSLLAVVSGTFMLRGRNWARWLALAWMAFHVVLSAFHTMRELAIHSLFFALLLYFLLRPAAASYFLRSPARSA